MMKMTQCGPSRNESKFETRARCAPDRAATVPASRPRKPGKSFNIHRKTGADLFESSVRDHRRARVRTPKAEPPGNRAVPRGSMSESGRNRTFNLWNEGPQASLAPSEA